MAPAARTPRNCSRLTVIATQSFRWFDAALASAGGARAVWLILISLKARRPGAQRELARAVGIEGATLTHHLDAMEADGLVTRRRDPANRRVQVVELTERGEAAFHTMRGAAVEYDRRLRAGLSDAQVAQLGALLDRLRENVSARGEPARDG